MWLEQGAIQDHEDNISAGEQPDASAPSTSKEDWPAQLLAELQKPEVCHKDAASLLSPCAFVLVTDRFFGWPLTTI